MLRVGFDGKIPTDGHPYLLPATEYSIRLPLVDYPSLMLGFSYLFSLAGSLAESPPKMTDDVISSLSSVLHIYVFTKLFLRHHPSRRREPLFLQNDIMAVQSKEALSPWGSALAGALGAVFANTCVYPLDM